jgi:hypothetical protein
MDKFLTAENKGMMWQLLMDAGAFANIDESHFGRVKQLYENTFNNISQIDQYNLTDKNKLVLTEMMKKLPYLKQQTPIRPLEEVKVKVDDDFKNKQNEYMKLVKHNKPQEIDFNDNNNTDEPIETEKMNSILNTMIATRERELNQILPEVQVKSKVNEKSEVSNNNDNNLDCKDYIWSSFKTGEKVTKNEGEKQKHVSFNNFMNKLKVTDDKPITELLQQILTNQEIIINKLNKLDKVDKLD